MKRIRCTGARRPGFTLIELVVVVLVLSLLVVLVLPAVQAAREAARRGLCANNLRQIGLALHLYQDACGSYPPGRYRSYDPRFGGPNPPCTSTTLDKSFLVQILPYVESAPAYHSVNHALAIFAAENTTLHSVSVAPYACPSDPIAGRPVPLNRGALAAYGLPDPPSSSWSMTMTSYAGVMGSLPVDALPSPRTRCAVPAANARQNNGCFHDVAPIRPASIVDGTSLTLLVAEKSVTMQERAADGLPGVARVYGWFVIGNWGDTLITTFYPPNPQRLVARVATPAMVDSASSLHPGGLNTLWADGSVRFLRDSIDSWAASSRTGRPVGAARQPDGTWADLPRAGIWQAISTRAGGESVGVQDL